MEQIIFPNTIKIVNILIFQNKNIETVIDNVYNGIYNLYEVIYCIYLCLIENRKKIF